MPTYDYKCENCGHAFELFQSMKNDPVRVCPECGEETVKRLIGAGAGLMFKGSGFYLTDYVKNGNGKTAATTAMSSAESSSSSEGSSTAASAGSTSSASSSTGESSTASTGSVTSSES